MCDFVSWIEWQGNLYYLTASDLRTKEGKKLLRTSSWRDICGHGAIRAYYPELHGRGRNWECTDFSSPNNFPPEIAGAIKAGKFRGVGFSGDLLTAEACKTFSAIWTEREDAIFSSISRREDAIKAAWIRYLGGGAEYERAYSAAWSAEDKRREEILLKFERKIPTLFWDLFSDLENRAPAWWYDLVKENRP